MSCGILAIHLRKLGLLGTSTTNMCKRAEQIDYLVEVKNETTFEQKTGNWVDV